MDHGYPLFVLWRHFWTPIGRPFPTARTPSPRLRTAWALLSYLKYYELRARREPAHLQTARFMGDYLVRESLTPNFPENIRAFTRSTGRRDQFPL